MSILIQLIDFRELCEGQHLQPNWNTEDSSEVTLKRHNLPSMKSSQTCKLHMLWELVEHCSIKSVQCFGASACNQVSSILLFIYILLTTMVAGV